MTRLRRYRLILALWLVAALLLPLVPAISLSQTQDAPKPGNTLPLTLADFGEKDGYTLKTVKTERQFAFTKPRNWEILPASSVAVTFQHSPALLPERSSLNVLVNNRILRTIELNDNNATPTTISIPVPPDILKDHNTLAFQVDQHYTYQCEDPFSSELWTTLLPETRLNLVYEPQPLRPNLAHFPYPFFDDLGYGPTRVGFLLSQKNIADETLEAAGVVATLMGQHAGWRDVDTDVADSPHADRNLVLIGTPKENVHIRNLKDKQPLSLDTAGNFLDPNSRKELPADYGIIEVLANPGHPERAILVISGNSPVGVRRAAHFLAQNPANKLMVGQYAIIEEQEPGPQHPFRLWDGFIRHAGETSFANMSLETLTARGITALPIYYNVRKMPDLSTPAEEKVTVRTVYSYSSQLDPTQSKLEVLLNDKAMASVPLDKRPGETQAVLKFEVPAEDFYTYNDLQYKFHLFPEKYDLCNFVTDVHIWGTVHNSSSVSVPGKITAPLPDVGLLNDGAFPFALFQDFSNLAFIMPPEPETADIKAMLSVATRFGRLSKSRTGINLSAVRPQTLTDAIRNDHHLVVIGPPKRNPILKDFNAKMKLLVEGGSAALREPLSRLAYDPQQGIVEETLSPWNDTRVGLIVSGETPEAMKRAARLFDDDKWYSAIEPGNLLVVNEDGPRSLTFLQRGEARFVYPSDYAPGPRIPDWAWIIFGFLAFIGTLTIIRLIFFRKPTAK